MVSVLGAWLKRLLVLILLVFLLVVLVNFVISNPQLVGFQLAGMQLPELKASTAVIFAFIVGGMCGLLASFVAIGKLRLANASFQRKLARRDAELQKLRANALKGLS
ncbi:LapA family protein [Endozoicomonas montiporae]|uniref:Lipopolysaccharide assembly protein A domain-containing protein n=1 Tax=Endozoicomonas montiporae CL-33 TaxID=570277 RepID=A0A142BDF4_9GAMM|nr:LapA family protein [Endozoicomonas montiporae]AMO56780.1 hypothetical protein EZMO1_2728 [Endozoicomonas montiporae CL-33]